MGAVLEAERARLGPSRHSRVTRERAQERAASVARRGEAIDAWVAGGYA